MAGNTRFDGLGVSACGSTPTDRASHSRSIEYRLELGWSWRPISALGVVALGPCPWEAAGVTGRELGEERGKPRSGVGASGVSGRLSDGGESEDGDDSACESEVSGVRGGFLFVGDIGVDDFDIGVDGFDIGVDGFDSFDFDADGCSFIFDGDGGSADAGSVRRGFSRQSMAGSPGFEIAMADITSLRKVA